LLGVKLANTKGFPVGKVNFLELYPLCFQEYLEALGETKLKEFIETIDNLEPLPGNLHEKLLQFFKEYIFLGGMPEPVAEYLHTHNFSKAREIQQAILNGYSLDFAKHAPKNQIMKINQIWDSISSQLAKENKKFIYSVLKEGARAKEFEEALQWLLEAGMIYKANNISAPRIPLKAYADPHIFKIYSVDVGLLGAMSQLSATAILQENELFREFRGALAENYVAQELAHSQFSLHYWTSEGKAEVDYIIEYNDQILPLEVKSGESLKKKSLKTYGEKYQPPLLIRTSAMNLKKDGNILNCPLYLIGELRNLLQLALP
jgi:predicted AAA+ superfamily ATPase